MEKPINSNGAGRFGFDSICNLYTNFDLCFNFFFFKFPKNQVLRK